MWFVHEISQSIIGNPYRGDCYNFEFSWHYSLSKRYLLCIVSCPSCVAYQTSREDGQRFKQSEVFVWGKHYWLQRCWRWFFVVNQSTIYLRENLYLRMKIIWTKRLIIRNTKVRGKTPMIGETFTGCCLGNVVKSTMNIAKYTFRSLSLILTYPSIGVLQGYLYMVLLGFLGITRVWYRGPQVPGGYRIPKGFFFLFGFCHVL